MKTAVNIVVILKKENKTSNPLTNKNNKQVMERQEIKKMFPITLEISQEMIDSKESLGDMLLKSIFPEEIYEDIFWGLSIGSVKGVLIQTSKTINHQGKQLEVPFYLQRVDITKPISVTFELRK